MDRTSCGEASMYLSFDSESTMNSLAYKTTNDISGVSVSNMEVDNSLDSHMNSTLEAQRDESDCVANFMKTVKKVETSMPPSPMRAADIFPKNILKEYNVLCSTPTKEQLMRTVQISRGSEGEGCIDLGLAFRGMEDDKQAMQLPVIPITEDKENNTHMENEEVFTLSSASSSSSVECVVTSVIYQKMATALSTTEEESLEELMECVEKTETAGDTDATPKPSSDVDATPKALGDVDASPKPSSDAGAPLKANNIVENVREEEAKQLVGLPNAANPASTTNKPKRGIPVPRNIRKSMCEPDLQSNRPSRIVFNGNKRTSLAAVSNNTKADKDIASDIPKLLDTMLKITNAAEKKENPTIEKRCESGKQCAAQKGRISMVPSQAQTGDKRTYNFAQRRMSVVVKTTLNSPARKIARKSKLPNGPQIHRSVMPQPVLGRKSVMPQPSLARRSVVPQPGISRRSVMPLAAPQPAIKNDAFAVRRSMLPMGKPKTTTTTTRTTVATTMCTSNTLTAAPSKENTISAKQTNRASIYPQDKDEKSSTTHNKPKISELSFVCNICACKFRIKSLLDAHKRSHEDDMAAAFVKKPSTRSTATTGTASSANQCKYCDKKFALVRALHIHLMQNCIKIPPGDKRKLHFTEMNHVEKAQLPEIFHHSSANSHSSSLSNSQANSTSNLSTAFATSQMVQKSHSNLSSAPMSSTESLIENKEITMIPNKIVTTVSTEMCSSVSSTQMAPPSINKVKVKKTAHAGVFRTPNKNIVCHTCKKSFKTIIEHINHNMMEHSKATPASGDSSNEQMETSANSST